MLDILDTCDCVQMPATFEFSAMRASYERTGQGFIVLFDVGSEESFENACDIIQRFIS